MWIVVQGAIGLLTLGVLVALALLAGPVRNAAVDGRANRSREGADGQTEHSGPPPIQFPGPFFPG
jgi:hypothetical protein